MTKHYEILLLILCGGSCNRLWPLSRESLPKQFLTLIFWLDYSLLQNTYKGVRDIPDLSNPGKINMNLFEVHTGNYLDE